MADNIAKLSASLDLKSDGFIRGMAKASKELEAYDARLKEQGISTRLATAASRDYAKQLYQEGKAVDNNHKSHIHLLADMENMKTKLKDFNGVGPFGLSTLTRNIAKATGIGIGFGQMIEKSALVMVSWIQNITNGIPILENFGVGISSVVSFLGEMLAILGPVAAAIIAVGAAIGILQAALSALLTGLGTAIAFFADLVAPVSILVTLLGGLAAAFVIGGKRAVEGGGKLNKFADIVDTLGSMFGKTSNILAHVFLPYLIELGHAGEKALNFFDKIIKMPLGEAFRTLDTQGTHLLGKFIDRVSQVLSKPIRLAFKVAFGDSAFSNMVSDWWHRFTGFLFGETERHPVEIRPGFFKMEPRAVNGVLQPFINWFHRHNFTKQGHEIGQQIGNGIMDAMSAPLHHLGRSIVNAFKGPLGPLVFPLIAHLGAFLLQIITSSAVHAARAIRSALGAAWGWVSNKAGGIWNTILGKISGVAGRAKSAITGALGSAWDAVKSQADNLWNHIKSLFSETLSIHVSLPHLPGGSLRDILGIAGGGIVPHIPGSQLGKDSVPAMLTPGEMVLNRSQQEALGGSSFLKDALGFAKGGIVPPGKRPHESKGHYRGRLHNWISNQADRRFTGLDNELQLLDRRASRLDSEGKISQEIPLLHEEQRIRSKEIKLYHDLSTLARKHGFMDLVRDFSFQAKMIRQDYLDEHDTIAGLKGAGSATSGTSTVGQVASMLAAFVSYASQYGSNIVLPGGIGMPVGGGAGGGGKTSGSTLVHGGINSPGGQGRPHPVINIHQHMVQHDDQFVHLRRASFAAQAAFS